MLRSLVGSEMCIRDRYKYRVHDRVHESRDVGFDSHVSDFGSAVRFYEWMHWSDNVRFVPVIPPHYYTSRVLLSWVYEADVPRSDSHDTANGASVGVYGRCPK
eukprot:TRINITY_DN10586_c0_g1_i1.p1 TRINITY_DN10586_c0_g1~~TRINITY_DN10586_c0_g1_i1.p1  ORF type:complete len:103 (+),score=6.87 TRINITY_DN10586_c0_g1_i1:140-448(+)